MVYYVYEEEFNGKSSSGAVKCFGPSDYLIGINPVRSTENSSEGICEIYKGEPSEPLNPYIEEFKVLPVGI